MTGSPEPTEPIELTHLLNKFNISSGYDKVNLDIGATRYFIHPELAIELAEALKRHAAELRPQLQKTEE